MSGLYVPNAVNFAEPLDIRMEHLTGNFHYTVNEKRREQPSLRKDQKILRQQRLSRSVISSPVSRILRNDRWRYGQVMLL